MNKYKPTGWKYESARHSLAAKGIKTSLYTGKIVKKNGKIYSIRPQSKSSLLNALNVVLPDYKSVTIKPYMKQMQKKSSLRGKK